VDPSTSADAPVAEPSEASASDAPAAHAATATDDPAPDAAAAAPAAAPAASTGERDDTATEPARDAVSAGVLDVEGVTAAFEAAVLPNLKGVAKALYTAGEVVTVEGDGTVVFALAIGAPVERARQSLPDVQRLLADHVGGPVTIRVIEDADAADARPGPPPKERRGATSGAESVPTPDDTDEADDEDTRIDISQLENADVAATGIDRLTQAFPGAVLISEDEMT
jgi:hypothetical protein